MKLHRFLFLVLLALLIASIGHAENEKDWMPDPHLRQAVRKALEIPDGIPMVPADIASLTHLVAEHDIKSLKGLEHAINLEFLHLGRTEVSDLTQLAGLENLQVLKLFDNRISDISQLSGLIDLEFLQLQQDLRNFAHRRLCERRPL